MPEQLPPKVAALLAGELGKPSPCAVCDQTTRNRDVFVPHNPVTFGGVEGKARYIILPVCSSCIPDPSDKQAWLVLEALVLSVIRSRSAELN